MKKRWQSDEDQRQNDQKSMKRTIKNHQQIFEKSMKIDQKSSKNRPKSRSGSGLGGSWGDGASSIPFFPVS